MPAGFVLMRIAGLSSLFLLQASDAVEITLKRRHAGGNGSASTVGTAD